MPEEIVRRHGKRMNREDARNAEVQRFADLTVDGGKSYWGGSGSGHIGVWTAIIVFMTGDRRAECGMRKDLR